MTNKIDWMEEYNDRTGVWRLKKDSGDFSSMDFIIPDKFSQTVESKETRVQVTYISYTTPPIVKILILPQDISTDYIFLNSIREYQSGILPNGWLQRTFIFETDYCPLFENVRILSPGRGEIFIDQVGIDTICRELDADLMNK